MSRMTTCTVCEKPMQRSRTSAASPKCRACRRATHGTSSRYRYGCRCDDCRAAATARVARWVATYAAERGEHPSTTYRRAHGRPRQLKQCKWCGVTHEDARSGIGQAHAQWARHHKPSPSRELVHVPRELRRWSSRFEPRSPATRRYWAVIVCGPCQWCGTAMAVPCTRSVARYCSRRCANGERKRAEGRFAPSARRRRALYERDGWTCQICQEPTLRTWVAGDPWSPSLDHIEPQSAALLPDHSDANLRTVHTICNSLRGDGRLTDREVRERVRGGCYAATA